MIKNIVFDIGNVLFKFELSSEIEKINTNEKRIEYINKIITHEQIWDDYIIGIVELNEVEKYFKSKYADYSLEIDILLQKKYQKYIIKQIDENVRILKRLSECFDIYIFSNISKETYEYMNENYDVFNYIKGGVYSYKEKIGKPEKKIFLKLIQKYGISPLESIYIDDKYYNIDIATELGFIGLKCGLDDKLKELLDKEGVLN